MNKKKFLKILLVLVLLAGLALGVYFIFFSEDEAPKECKHSDANVDGICDICGDVVGLDICNHTDANNDKVCDSCGASLAPVSEIADDIEALNTKYNAVAPTKVVINTKQSFGDYVLSGKSTFKSGKVDGYAAAVFENTYQQLRDIESGSNAEIVDIIETITELWEYSEENGYRENGGKWDPYGYDFSPMAGDIAINISEELITEFVNDAENGMVTFKVSADNAEKVFGEALTSDRDYKVEGDISVTIYYSVADITGISYSYSVKNSDNKNHPTVAIEVSAEYSYKTETIAFK